MLVKLIQATAPVSYILLLVLFLAFLYFFVLTVKVPTDDPKHIGEGYYRMWRWNTHVYGGQRQNTIKHKGKSKK